MMILQNFRIGTRLAAAFMIIIALLTDHARVFRDLRQFHHAHHGHPRQQGNDDHESRRQPRADTEILQIKIGI